MQRAGVMTAEGKESLLVGGEGVKSGHSSHLQEEAEGMFRKTAN